MTHSAQVQHPVPGNTAFRHKQRDRWDWRGCNAVQFDPEKLSGRATVGATRMDADGVLLNFQSGLTAEEISEDFSVPVDDVRTIIDFAQAGKFPILD